MTGPMKDGAGGILAVLVALLVGLAAGAFGARWLSNAPAAAPAVPESQTRAPGDALEDAILPYAPELAGSDRTRVADAVAPSAAAPDVLIGEALRSYASAGITQGWGKVRKDEMPAEDLAEGMKSYEKLVLESPASIGRSLGERRTKAEAALQDARTGGVFALLETLDAGGVGPLPGLVQDPKQFEPLFQRAGPEGFRSGLANRDHPDQEVEDAVTLTWPAGVFKLGPLLREKNPYPRDVTLAGAGIDATMLVLSTGQLITTGGLSNFAIRDCTVHTNNNYLFDLRTKAASIRLERLRIVGFDMGAGASCALGTEALALFARNCRFEGGFGMHPQYGTLFDVRTDALLARFENCTFSLIKLGVSDLRHGATVFFSGCKLDQILDDPITPG